MATTTQVTNFSENEADGLAKFLGHDIRVHRDFYRLQENVFVCAKLSKVLVAIDKGQVDKIKGKTMDEIELSGKHFFNYCRFFTFLGHFQTPFIKTLLTNTC